MNYEQKLRLPTTRKEFLVNTFASGKVAYALGLGIFVYARYKGKIYSPRPGQENPFVGDDYSAITFVYAPTDDYLKKAVEIDHRFEIVQFDFRQVMSRYVPNTGLTIAKDKNGLVTLLLNYRKESSGEEKISFLGVNKQFALKEIDTLKPYSSVIYDEKTQITKILPLD